MKIVRVRHPSAALVVSVVALIASLGGTSYAAFSLPKNSVGTPQLQPGAVATGKIKDAAVTKAKLNVTGLTVPNALHANNASVATNAAKAYHATSANFANTANSLPALSWQKLPLQNGAVTYNNGGTAVFGTPSYTKDAEGFVHLSGGLYGQTVPTGSPFTVLPPGFRPTRADHTWLRAASTNGNGDPQLVDISIDTATGNVYLQRGTGSTSAFVDLDGISFYAG